MSLAKLAIRKRQNIETHRELAGVACKTVPDLKPTSTPCIFAAGQKQTLVQLVDISAYGLAAHGYDPNRGAIDKIKRG